jgi:predicted site-specific integrase-resolvase
VAEKDDELLSLDEAAAEFKVSRMLLYRAEKAGQLRLQRRPRGTPRVQVRRSDVARLLEPRDLPPQKRTKKRGRR